MIHNYLLQLFLLISLPISSDDVSGYQERQQAVLKQVLAAKYPKKTVVTAFGRQYKVEADGETFYI